MILQKNNPFPFNERKLKIKKYNAIDKMINPFLFRF